MQHHIFLSYSHHDTVIMERVRAYLTNAGLDVWIDETGIEPGTPSWKRAIQSALRESGCLVVIFSPDANESFWVGEELNYANVQGLETFPILARGDERSAVPFGYAAAQWIDIRNETRFEPALEKLAATVFKHLGIDSSAQQRAREESKQHAQLEAEHLTENDRIGYHSQSQNRSGLRIGIPFALGMVGLLVVVSLIAISNNNQLATYNLTATSIKATNDYESAAIATNNDKALSPAPTLGPTQASTATPTQTRTPAPSLAPAQTLQPRTFTGHTDQVNSVAFSPDGKSVLTGSRDHTARLWDAQSGQSVLTFKGHTGDVNAVAFSPDGKYVLTGSADQTAQLWDAQSGQSVRTFKGHTDQVTSVAFSPDGKYVLTGSADQTAQLWDAQGGQSIRTFNGHTDQVTSVAFSPDGKYVLTGSNDYTARLWDTDNAQLLVTFSGHKDQVTSVAFSPDGKYVLTGSRDYTAQLWDSQGGQAVLTFMGHSDGVLSVVFSPDGNYVLTGSADDTARLWDAQNGNSLHTFAGHAGDVNAVAFSPDGKQAFTGGADSTARLWESGIGG